MSGSVLKIEGLSKSFHRNQVLKNVDLTFLPGEVHVLVGENGAGKSTILKLIMGLYRQDSGEILLNGEPCVSHTPLEARRRGIAMVYQELSLLPEMSVFDNIFLGNESIWKAGLINRQEMRGRLKEKCTQFGVVLDPDELVKNLPLSKKLMVEVVKVLITEPDVVLFDEATSALDTEEVQCLANIIKILREQNKTYFHLSQDGRGL